MKRILICTGVLGGGTALTFAAAMLAATLMPDGAMIPATNSDLMFGVGGGVQMKGGVAVPVPVPANGVIVAPGTIITVPGPTDGP